MNSKITTKNGYHIPAHQHTTDYKPAKSEFVITPSTNQANWGSMFYIDLRELDTIYHEHVLQFNLSALTGLTGNNGFIPANLWIDHIDYIQASGIQETYLPDEQFINCQLFQRDEDRLLENVGAGSYSNSTQRLALSGATSSYYIRLKDFYFQAKTIPHLFPAHQLQIRVFLKPLADVVSGGTGTPVCSINSVNVISRVTRLKEAESNALKASMNFNKVCHYKCNDVKPFRTQVNTGVTTASLVLTSITGPVSYLFFVVRPTNALTAANTNVYTAISSYEILNSSGTNIIGGQAIPNSEALLVIGNSHSKSTYLAETALGITNNNANVYLYSFAADCPASANDAMSTGNYVFTGAEQLKINFPSALASAVQVDVYAFVESVVEFSKGSVKKIQFNH